MTLAVPAMSALGIVDFTVTASAPQIDAVIGLSAGPATWFPDIAAGVRLAPTGKIDVRDGADYRVDVTRSYGTTARNFHVIADLTSHTYSVIQGSFTSADELARQYAFRTEQQAVAALDHVSVIVDGSVGSVSVCAITARPSSGVVYSREGEYAVAPLAGDAAVLSDGATARQIDAGGQPVGPAVPGGALAVDATGNVIIARISGAALVVDTYAPGLTSIGQASFAVAAGTTVKAVSAAGSDVVVALAAPADPNTTIVQLSGNTASSHAIQGGAVALDGDQAVVLWSEASAIRVARFAADGTVVWSRSFAGRADLTALTVDPDHRVVFGGELQTSVDFGGGALPLASNPDHALNGFVVELSAAGDHVFSARTGGSWVGGVASNGDQVVVSGTLWTQFPHFTIQAFDVAGAPVALPAYDLGVVADRYGRGGKLAIGAAGRLWWNVRHQWQLTPQFPFLFVLGA